jgi:membrane associated rhomboid family serine protease
MKYKTILLFGAPGAGKGTQAQWLMTYLALARVASGDLFREHVIHSTKLNGNLQKMWLEPHGRANPKALDAIKKADVIVIGPGDLYSSLIPNLLVKGLPEAIRASKAKKIFVCNLMSYAKHSKNFSVADFVDTIEKYLGGAFDTIVYNSKAPSKSLVERYAREGETLTRLELPKNRTLIALANLSIYLLNWAEPQFIAQLRLTPDRVFAGEWWRVITFLFVPPLWSPLAAMLWFFLLYQTAQALEQVWGEFRFCFYYGVGAIVTALAALFIAEQTILNTPLNTSLLLAFAALFPEMEVLLFLIIPIKVKYLGWFMWISTIYAFIVGGFVTRVAIGASLRPGQTVQFHLRDANTSRDDLKMMLSQAKSNQAAGAVLFSCVGRGRRLYGTDNHDSELLKSVVGNIPVGDSFATARSAPSTGKPICMDIRARLRFFLRARSRPNKTSRNSYKE